MLCPGNLSCMDHIYGCHTLWLLVGFGQWGADRKCDRGKWERLGYFLPQLSPSVPQTKVIVPFKRASRPSFGFWLSFPSSLLWACAVLRLDAQSCPTVCDVTDCSPPGSSVHGDLQARILEPRGSNTVILLHTHTERERHTHKERLKHWLRDTNTLRVTHTERFTQTLKRDTQHWVRHTARHRHTERETHTHWDTDTLRDSHKH